MIRLYDVLFYMVCSHARVVSRLTGRARSPDINYYYVFREHGDK